MMRSSLRTRSAEPETVGPATGTAHDASASDGQRPMVRIEGVTKDFGHTRVLDGIDLSIERGSVCVIIGPSGSGKSTLLRCINHLEPVTSGRIWIDGDLMGYREHGGVLHEQPERQTAHQRARIGMVFQQFNLFPHLTAVQNVMIGPIRVLGVPRQDAWRRAVDLLDTFGLGGRKDARPSQLSGGQQQRVAIARALAMDPKVVLFDEPTSALDPEMVGEVLEAMRALVAMGMTMVVVTHEIDFARDVASQVVFICDGRVVEAGNPAAVLDHPSHARTRAFLGNVRRDPADRREPDGPAVSPAGRP